MNHQCQVKYLFIYWKKSKDFYIQEAEFKGLIGSIGCLCQLYIFWIISLTATSELACQTASSLNAWKKPALKVFRDLFELTVSKISNAKRIYFDLILFTATKSIINARSLYFLDCERPSRIDFFIIGSPCSSIILNRSIISVDHSSFIVELKNLRFFG